MRDHIKELFKNATRALRRGEYNNSLYCLWFELTMNFRDSNDVRNILIALVNEVMDERAVETKSQSQRDEHLNALVNYHLKDNFREAIIYFNRVIQQYESHRNISKDIYADALNARGYMYMHGRGETKFATVAVNFFKRAGDRSSFALNNLGLLYAEGCSWVPKNINLARYYYNKAIAYSNPIAMRNLASILNDRDQAFFLMKRAADLMHSLAIFDLANQYAMGEAVARDYQKAIELFDRAAELGKRPTSRSVNHNTAQAILELNWNKLISNQAIGLGAGEILTQFAHLVTKLISLQDLKVLRQAMLPESSIYKILDDYEREKVARHLYALEILNSFLGSIHRIFKGKKWEPGLSQEILEYSGHLPKNP